MAASPIYSYLNPSQEEIRLLEITATDPSITCNISIVSLHESPKFCALSYVWGSATTTEEITVNGSTMSITKSLANALKYVPMHWKAEFPHENTRPLLLWADAICINQGDVPEKNHQVPLMTKIYSTAEATFCSLNSEESSMVVTALETLNLIATRASENGFDPGSKDAQEPKTDWMREELAAFGPDPVDTWGKDAPMDLRNQPGFEALGGNKAEEAVLHFKHLAYWTRAWIFQEAVLSRNVIFFHTCQAIKFETLMLVLFWADAIQDQARPVGIDFFFWRAITSFSSFYHLKVIHATRLISDVYRSLPGHKQEEAALMVRGQDLLGNTLKATNPKDHVYALLGLTNLDITPDYSDSTTVEAVYVEFCVKRLKALRSHPDITPLDFLDWAGYANSFPGAIKLPSWVPNFPGCSKNNRRWIIPYLCASSEKFNEGFSGWSNDISIHEQSLFTTALVIGSLEDVSDAFTRESESSSEQFVASIFRIIGQETQEASKAFMQYCDRPHPLLKLASALCGTKVEADVWDSPEVLRVLRLLQSLLLTKTDVNTIFSQAFLDKTQLGTGWLFWLSYAYGCGSSKNDISKSDDSERPHLTEANLNFVLKLNAILRERSLEDLETTANIQYPFPDILHFLYKIVDGQDFKNWNFVMSVQEDREKLLDMGVRVARTGTREFGLVPPDASKGDLIVLLTGSDGLFVVRKVDDHYVLIGPAGFLKDLVDPILEKVNSGEEEFKMIEVR